MVQTSQLEARVGEYVVVVAQNINSQDTATYSYVGEIIETGDQKFLFKHQESGNKISVNLKYDKVVKEIQDDKVVKETQNLIAWNKTERFNPYQ